jgi:adenylylsulfate kinase-like enzyme
MTIWLIGMSASGKTTIGKKLFEKLDSLEEKWIFLDGDTFRNIFGEDLGHTVEDRRKNAYRISRFCEYMNSQNVSVLACVLSIFYDNQKYNKENIENYKEVFIDVSFDKLIQRDNKELYKNALDGKIKNVVGVDIEFKVPYSPDLIIDNNPDNKDYEDIVKSIINNFNLKTNNKYAYTQNNLLEKPHKYQYSKFEGTLFFDKLNDDRKDAINFLKDRLKKLDVSKMNLDRYNSFYEDNNLVLKKFLVTLYFSDKLDSYLKIIHLLIKRFEVSKKLYLSYDKNEIRKRSLDYSELLNYPLFSLVLQRFYKDTDTQDKFIYLNAILKLNDIISSIKSDYIIDIEIYYAKLALESESKIIKELL